MKDILYYGAIVVGAFGVICLIIYSWVKTTEAEEEIKKYEKEMDNDS